MKLTIATILSLSVIFASGGLAYSDSIPDWVKGVAAFWANDEIDDSEFISALEFLIESGVIHVTDPRIDELESDIAYLTNQLLKFDPKFDPIYPPKTPDPIKKTPEPPKKSASPKIESSFSQVSFPGTSLVLKYEITNGKLYEIVPNHELAALLISVNAISDTDLNIIVPRIVLDANTFNGVDDVFYVFDNGDEVSFEENPRARFERSLTISLDKGFHEIELVGTYLDRDLQSISLEKIPEEFIGINTVSAEVPIVFLFNVI